MQYSRVVVWPASRLGRTDPERKPEWAWSATAALLLTIVSLTVTGCSHTPLNHSETVRIMSAKTPLSADTVWLTSYCAYAVATPTARTGDFEWGTLAATNDRLVIYNGDPDRKDFRRALDIEIASIRGAELRMLRFLNRPHQIQVLLDNSMLAIQLSHPNSKIDIEGMTMLYGRLRGAGVPEVKFETTLDPPATMIVPIMIR